MLPMLQTLYDQVATHLSNETSGKTYRTLVALNRMMEDARRYGTFQFWR